ncbi:YiiX/YebB-like N1pC/P60 family cysteine hydrolase [Xanthomonas euvesicatoria]
MKMMLACEMRAGDVLLCYKDAKIDPVGKGITHVTDSEYTHAAICISSSVAAEATVSAGVAKVQLESLNDHVAVFRQPDAWKPASRIQVMNEFIDYIVASEAKYNLRDVVTFKNRRKFHQLSISEQLHAFFNGTYVPSPIEKGRYFCSELVVSCFVITGFIDASAEVLYKPNVISPGALGRDSTFGTFLGYVSCKPNYSIPAADEFINYATLDQIFGSGV